MNIEHDGKTYEVLAIDRIKLITHARLAGGKVVGTKIIDDTAIRCESPFGKHLAHTDFLFEELEHFGIQPLRLVPNEPVTFEAWTAIVNFHGNDVVAIICPKDVHIDMKFQCVAVDK
jgi:hypothetical protein